MMNAPDLEPTRFERLTLIGVAVLVTFLIIRGAWATACDVPKFF